MRLRQPDRRSCGAACLVVARMVLDSGYADRVAAADAFADEVRSLHRRITSSLDVAGAVQLPWTRLLGTPPWAVRRDLARLTGRAYRVELVRLDGDVGSRLAGVDTPAPVAVYVGSRWLPRHVVLVLESQESSARVYEPASGQVLAVAADRWRPGGLGLAGWSHPWFVVSPRP